MRKKLIKLILTVSCVLSLSGCSSDDKLKQDLISGQRKYSTGAPMTKSEYNAVKSFNDWKYKNSSHTYSDWDN